MIFEALFEFALAIVDFLVGLLPNADTEVLDFLSFGLADFKSRLEAANWIFPVHTFFFVLSTIFAIEAGILAFKLVKWAIRNLSAGHFGH